jgi:hypothetical protein
MAHNDETPPTIGWLRAILTSVGIVVVGILLLVYVPNWILTKINGKTRSSLVALATITFFVVFVALAWTLRWLQRRKVI